MSEATATAATPEAGPAEFLQIWSESFSQVMGQITGSPVASAMAAEAPPDLAPAAESDLWAMVTSTGGLRGEMAMRLGAATVLRLAQAFMSEPPAPEVELTGDHREAVIELLRQIAGIAASGAKARWGEIQLRVEVAPAAPSWPSAATLWLQAGEEGPARMTLEFACSAALVAELRAEKAEASKAAPAEAAPAISNPAASAPAADSGQETGALELLMDVQLTMTMRFGSRQMLLREVLDLNPGAVVELDRRVQEPVDLLLDGKLVARGEVVVIDGSYGLRVTDVTALGPPRAQ
jgi:flagellar motor switch protein FliN/FliY